MNGILKKSEKEELLKKLKEVISFSAKKIKKEYGSFLNAEQLKRCQFYEHIREEELEKEFAITDVMISYLRELHHMGIYETTYLLNDYHKKEAQKEVKESIIKPLSFKMYAIDYHTNRKTFFEYALGMGVRFLFSKLILLDQEETKDVFVSSFEKRLKEGIVELYARKLCFNESYQKEFYKKRKYPFPTSYLYAEEKNLSMARIVEAKIGPMIFQNSYHDIFQTYPNLKQLISLESLREMKEELLKTPKMVEL